MFDFIKRFWGYLFGKRRIIADDGCMRLVKEKSGKLKILSNHELTAEEIFEYVTRNMEEIMRDD